MAATNKRGIFTLQDVKVRQGSGNWPTEAFTKPPYSLDWQYGYAVGGSDRNVPQLTSVDRVDYSNDNATASVRGFLAAARGYNNSVSSRTFGYSTGGRGPTFPAYTSDTQRISYANDTATAVPKGNLTQPWSGGQAVDTINYGYLLGGYKPPTNGTLTNRIDFSNDTNLATPVGNMDVDRYAGAGCGNEDYGYAGTGLINSNANNSSSISRIDYSSDTTQLSPKGPLSTEKRTTLSSSNSNFGYWAGYSPSTRVDKYDFANDTTTIVADLPNPQFYSGATGNASFGYYMAGYRSAPSMQTTVNRLDYSNDTSAMSVRGPLTFEKLGFNAVSGKSNVKPETRLSIAAQGVGIATDGATVQYDAGRPVFSYPYGYLMGGSPSQTYVHRIDYANDGSSPVPRGNLDSGQTYGGATANNDYAYAVGGVTGYASIVNRIDFSNDTAKAVRTGDMTLSIIYNAGVSNRSHAYYCGGLNPSVGTYSTVQRQDYASDTTTMSPKGPLSAPKKEGGASGTQNYGWVYAADQPGINTRIDRIDYSSDTVTATHRSNCLSRRYGLYGATGNENFGYFSGGETPALTSSTERFEYANDTAGTVYRGNLTEARYRIGATGNNSFGYFAAGATPSTVSTVSRMDFSNDTNAMSVRGSLPITIHSASAASSQDDVNPKPVKQINDLKGPLAVVTPGQQYGYVAGGDYGPDVSTIERIDYANDTPGTSVRTSLPTATYGASFVGNAYYGYYGGGFTPGPTVRSTVERVDFSNDTLVGPVGPLSLARGFFGPQAAGNQNYGWFAGGFSATDRVDRIDYANDLNTASPRTSITAARYGMAAVGNLNYGYWCGGNPGPVSYIERITYADDTVTQITGLSQGRRYAAATGNTNYGWIGGGNLPSPITSYSIVDRIDYSNDTAVASVRGTLSLQRYQLTATGNKDYGYWFGGFYPASYSTVDRVDFANDTVTATQRGFITQARYDLVAASAAANGLPQG